MDVCMNVCYSFMQLILLLFHNQAGNTIATDNACIRDCFYYGIFIKVFVNSILLLLLLIRQAQAIQLQLIMLVSGIVSIMVFFFIRVFVKSIFKHVCVWSCCNLF